MNMSSNLSYTQTGDYLLPNLTLHQPKTPLGNGLLFIGPILYKRISISATWSIFVIVCAISMFAMLAMVKWLERVTK